MPVKDLLKTWNLPDTTNQRAQITLRIPFKEYARLHALKEAYPQRSVNDMITDLVSAGLDELVDALPQWPADEDDVREHNDEMGFGAPSWAYLKIGEMIGPRVRFDNAYARIINEKSSEESEEETKMGKVLKVINEEESA
jgi:hypothetical protein